MGPRGPVILFGAVVFGAGFKASSKDFFGTGGVILTVVSVDFFRTPIFSSLEKFILKKFISSHLILGIDYILTFCFITFLSEIGQIGENR